MKIPTKKVTAFQREVMRKHSASPMTFTPRDVMKRLRLAYDYNAFCRLYYQCARADTLAGETD